MFGVIAADNKVSDEDRQITLVIAHATSLERPRKDLIKHHKDLIIHHTRCYFQQLAN